MKGDKLIIIAAKPDGWTASEPVHMRFSDNSDGDGMTEGLFDSQNYVGVSVDKVAPTDKSGYTWFRIIGETSDGESGFSAEQIVAFAKASGGVAFTDKPDYTVTNQVISLLRENTYFTIKWVINGVTFEQQFAEGTVPTYSGTPVKGSTEEYDYTFSGWTPTVVSASADATYTAMFTSSLRYYDVTWTCNGAVLKVEKCKYGSVAKWDGENPTMESNTKYSYDFTGWEPSPDVVTGNVTYDAQFSPSVRLYTVKWVNEDGTVLKTANYSYGATPEYGNSVPTKASTDMYTFSFSGWTPAMSEVVGDTTYTAQFKEEVRKYTITWMNGDTALLAEQASYGDMPSWNGDAPTKDADAQFTYAFIGWLPAISTVTSDITYTAQFSATPIESEDAWYTVTLSETDGDYNKTTLQDALDNHKNVIIATGTYPLTPSVTVTSGTLDLGNSVITSTASKYSGGLICLAGENPVVQNGELAGNFHEKSPSLYIIVNGEKVINPEFFEGESLVSPVANGHTNSTVENVRLHNCWGYAISERGTIGWDNAFFIGIPDENCNYVYSGSTAKTGATAGSTVTQTDSGWSCTTVDMPLDTLAGTPRLKYVYVQGGLAYYRVISDDKVDFTFTLSDGSKTTVSAWQGMPVEIPTDAAYVSVTLKWNSGNTGWKSSVTTNKDGTTTRTYKKVYIRATDYAGGLTVRNCKTYYNSSLGMTGTLTGATIAENCESWGNGHPEEGVANSQTTVGFIDIEDNVTPYITLRNCTSKDDLNFAMLGALHMTVENCTADGATIIYRGIDATVTDTDSPIGTFSMSVTTPITVTNCIIRSSTVNKLSSYMKTSDCTFYNVAVRAANDTNGTYIYTNAYCTTTLSDESSEGAGDAIIINGIGNLNGKIACTIDSRIGGSGCLLPTYTLAADEGSSVKIACNESRKGSESTAIGVTASGNCSGIQIDDTFLPNGNTVSDSTFTPGTYTCLVTPQKMFGTFENCTFNLDNSAFATASTHMYDKKVVFKNCEIHNLNNYLFDGASGYGVGSGTELVFENCLIDDTKQIAKTSENATVSTSGTPTITITSDGTVSIPTASVRLGSSSGTLSAGNAFTLVATVIPMTATNRKIIWSSSDDSVAIVTASENTLTATVTGVSEGVATITAKTEDGGFEATYTATVIAASVSLVDATGSTGITKGYSQELSVSQISALTGAARRIEVRKANSASWIWGVTKATILLGDDGTWTGTFTNQNGNTAEWATVNVSVDEKGKITQISTSKGTSTGAPYGTWVCDVDGETTYKLKISTETKEIDWGDNA